MTLEQLKQAYDLGATHVPRRAPLRDRFLFKVIDGKAFIQSRSNGGFSKDKWSVFLGGEENMNCVPIDYSPLDDYYSDKALDIRATGVGE